MNKQAEKLVYEGQQKQNYKAALKLFCGGKQMYKLVTELVENFSFQSNDDVVKSIENIYQIMSPIADKQATAQLESISTIKLQTEGYRLVGEEIKKDKQEWKQILLTKYVSEYILDGKLNQEELNSDLYVFFS